MRLNEASIKTLEPPLKGNTITYDDAVPGFGIRVTANNSRAFVLTYWVRGRQRRMTIDRWPVWTATAARERAREVLALTLVAIASHTASHGTRSCVDTAWTRPT